MREAVPVMAAEKENLSLARQSVFGLPWERAFQVAVQMLGPQMESDYPVVKGSLMEHKMELMRFWSHQQRG